MAKAPLMLTLVVALWAAAGAGAQEGAYQPRAPLNPLLPAPSPVITTPPPITSLPFPGPNPSPGAGPAQAPPPAPPAPPPPGAEPLDVSADSVRYLQARRLVVAAGHVRASYRELEVNADQLTANLATQRAVFSGAVRLVSRGETLHAASLYLDLESGLWQLRQVSGALSPDFFAGGVIAPVLVGAEEVTGGQTPLILAQAHLSTCDLPRPHYVLTARRVLIYPGRRLVARQVSLYLGSRRLITLGYFSLPLRERGQVPIVPELGENEIDGRYLKTRYNYGSGGGNSGSVLLDVTERRGLGTGIDQGYGWPRGAGSLLLYQIGRWGETPELQGRLSHRQELGGGLNLEAFADYRRNSGYYLPGSELLNSQLLLTRAVGGAVSRLGLTYNETRSLTDRRTLLASLQHAQTFGRRTLTLDSTYQRHHVTGSPADDVEVNNHVRIVDRHRPFDLVLDYAKRLDPDSYRDDSFYQALDRLPQLTLESTSYRLPALSLFHLPARASLSLGEFFERPTDLRASRFAFSYDTLPVTHTRGGLRLSGQAGFRQTMYGDRDHTAQYAYNGWLGLEQRLTRHWSLRTSYYLLKPKGYTPFRFDYLGSYENATAGFVFDNGRAGRVSLLTGYDFDSNAWRNLQLRLNERLTRTVSLALSSAYDFNRGEPREVALLGVLHDSRVAWALGARFDPRTSQFRRLTSEFEWQITPKWRLQAINGWDGVQHVTIYNELLLVRDLHCWEALLYYSQSRRMLRFDLRLKAFEWGRRDFGVTRTGQYISPVPPEVY